MQTRFLVSAVLTTALVACSSGSDNDTCGDGVKGATEQCDDGNTSNGDGCSSTCHSEAANSCGDGVVDVSREECDDGNTSNGDGCSATCHDECGNGMLEGTEECDDGNKVAADGCTALCKVEAGYTCTGEPSDCTAPTGTCGDPFVVALAPNSGNLVGTGAGDTTTGTDQVPEALCDGFTSGGGNDNIWQFTLTDTRDVTITIDATTPFDATLRLLGLPCDQASEIPEYIGGDGCSDYGVENEGEYLQYTALPAGTYYVVIDAYDTTQKGAYSFSVSAAPTLCGNGTLDAVEICDDGNTMPNDGCSTKCDVEAGYVCTGTPSVCTSACGSGTIETGEECDDGGTVDGDRCSATCTLESDVAEVEPNDTTAQVLTATNHIIRGSFTAGDVDLYTFTLTAPATVELETYDTIDPSSPYEGVGTLTQTDCYTVDSEIRVFDAAGDVTMNDTAKFYDDEDGSYSCSYVGPNDSDDLGATLPMEGMLQAGTYTIKVNHYDPTATAGYYILDFKISTSTPVAPVAGDLVLNEFMPADNMSDTNCDGIVTGTYDEFVELVNVSSKTLDLTGLTIADSVVTRHVFAPAATGSMTLEPGKAVVVWAGGAPACAGVTDWFVASSGQLGLNDAGDTITVKDAAMNQLAQVVYPAATLNVSRNLSPDVTGTTYANHNAVVGAVGNYSPGKRADGTAF